MLHNAHNHTSTFIPVRPAGRTSKTQYDDSLLITTRLFDSSWAASSFLTPADVGLISLQLCHCHSGSQGGSAPAILYLLNTETQTITAANTNVQFEKQSIYRNQSKR